MKRTKIFLGGFINYINAQNLNCLALAKYLNKDKFSIYTLQYYSGTLENQTEKIRGVRIFNCFKPAKLSLYLGFLWGIWHCDIAYLPKGELWKFNRFLLWLFNKKSFKTIEGVLDKDNVESLLEVLGDYKEIRKSYNYVDKLYAISNFLGNYNSKHHQIKVERKVLHLGCDIDVFRNKIGKTGDLKRIIFVGRLKRRKGLYDFIEIAHAFPTIEFLIFGNGEEKEHIETYITEKKMANLKLMGTVDHSTLANFLIDSDLHIFPSRSEGFPKVTLETAAAGVPSIMYGDYGADEWIVNNKNGWVVKTVNDILVIIEDLKDNPIKLKQVSNEAIKLAESFDWKIKVKDWEEEILSN